MNNVKTGHISELEVPDISEMTLEGFDEHESSLNFEDPYVVRENLIQHFINGEHETFFEILALYMDFVGKAKISQETKIPERTIYNFIKGQHKTSSENIFKVMKYISSEVERKSA